MKQKIMRVMEQLFKDDETGREYTVSEKSLSLMNHSVETGEYVLSAVNRVHDYDTLIRFTEELNFLNNMHKESVEKAGRVYNYPRFTWTLVDVVEL